MAYVVLFLVLYFGVVFCVIRVTLDPSVVNLKPVNNAHFPNQTTDLYGTNVVGHYKWISKTGSFKRDVYIANINDVNPKNMLFCPRSDQNPFMALYLKTSTNRRLVCKEKFANFPIRLFCESNPSRFHKCSDLYIENKNFTSNFTPNLSMPSTGFQTDDLTPMTTEKTASMSNDDLKLFPADSSNFFMNNHVLFFILLILCAFVCVLLSCFLIVAFIVTCKRTSLFSSQRDPLIVVNTTALPNDNYYRSLHGSNQTHYLEQNAVNPQSGDTS